MTPHLAGASKETAAKAAADRGGGRRAGTCAGEPLAHCANPEALPSAR